MKIRARSGCSGRGVRSWVAVAVIGILVSGPVQEADSAVYWSDMSGMYRANPDGSVLQPLLTGGETVLGIALDSTAKTLYYSQSESIFRAELDGSDSVELIHQDGGSPMGIALDTAAGKIYWADSLRETLSRANLDGSDIELLVGGPLYGSIEDVALDLDTRTMFWTNASFGTVHRGDMDGVASEIIATGDAPYGIALDPVTDKLYWGDVTFATDLQSLIRRSDVDGSNQENLVAYDGEVYDFALDLSAGQMYWNTGDSMGSLYRAMLDGSDVEKLPISVTNGWAIALDDVLLLPVPEPATLLMLAVGVVVLISCTSGLEVGRVQALRPMESGPATSHSPFPSCREPGPAPVQSVAGSVALAVDRRPARCVSRRTIRSACRLSA